MLGNEDKLEPEKREQLVCLTATNLVSLALTEELDYVARPLLKYHYDSLQPEDRIALKQLLLTLKAQQRAQIIDMKHLLANHELNAFLYQQYFDPAQSIVILPIHSLPLPGLSPDWLGRIARGEKTEVLFHEHYSEHGDALKAINIEKKPDFIIVPINIAIHYTVVIFTVDPDGQIIKASYFEPKPALFSTRGSFEEMVLPGLRSVIANIECVNLSQIEDENCATYIAKIIKIVLKHPEVLQEPQRLTGLFLNHDAAYKVRCNMASTLGPEFYAHQLDIVVDDIEERFARAQTDSCGN